MHIVNTSDIPAELRKREQWVLWREEIRGDNDRPTKIPYSTTGQRASSTDANTWTTFDDALSTCGRNNGTYNGIGFVFSPEDPFCGIDLDDCIDEAATIAPEAQAIIDTLNSYSEVSPSGKGVKVFVCAELLGSGKNTKKINGFGGLEMYCQGRYFTITARHLPDTPTTIEQRQAEIDKLYKTFFDKPKAPIPPSPVMKAKRARPSNIIERCKRYLEPCSDSISGQRGHDFLFHAACECMRFGLSDAEAFEVLQWYNATKCSPQWPEKDIRYKIGSARAKVTEDGEIGCRLRPKDARGKCSNPTPEDANDKPVIVCNDRELCAKRIDCVLVLRQANDPPYIRNGEFVHLDTDDHGQTIIKRYTIDALRGLLSDVATFINVTYDDEEMKTKHISPPMDVTKDLFARPDPSFPRLAAVVEAPVLRPDGTLLDTPGYDQETRLMYVPANGLDIRLPDPLTQEHARKGAEYILNELLIDFPFVDQAAQANVLATLLTPLVRPMIDGRTPLANITATQAGTGKSLLATLISLVTTGRDGAMMAPPRTGEEWSKTITSALDCGRTIIIFDNVSGAINSRELDAVITAPTWTCRRLGTNEMAEYRPQVTWVATGNNITVGGDLARRCYWIRLDAATYRPELRTTFRHPDIVAWTAGNRGQLLSCLLAMARAWVVADRPEPTTIKLGSFEKWSTTVGGILQYAGVEGFLTNWEADRDDSDIEGPQWQRFLAALLDATDGVGYTAAQIEDLINRGGNNELRELLPDWLADVLKKTTKSFTRSLGRALQSICGRRFDHTGLRVEKADKEFRRAIVWKVVCDV